MHVLVLLVNIYLPYNTTFLQDDKFKPVLSYKKLSFKIQHVKKHIQISRNDFCFVSFTKQ